MAHKWAKWLTHPCRIGNAYRFRAGVKIRSGPQVGKAGYLSGEQNQKWPVSGIPTASERGAEVARKWGLPHPYHIGDPHRFRAGVKIRSGPQVGKAATSPLPYRGSPPLQSGGQNQKWPTSGQNGYLTPTILGIPTASERGSKSEVAHKWAKRLPHPCRIGDPHRCRAAGKIRSGPQVGKVATSPLPYRGSPPLQSGGAKSEVAHKWAKWLPHPCRIGDRHGFRAGGKIRSGPQVGKVANSPLPYRGSLPLQSGGQNQKWPTSGPKWLPHPCRIGDPHRCRAGSKIRSGPQVGKVATSPLPYRGAAKRGAKSEVAHKWAKWLPHPYHIGDPHRYRAGVKIRSGPQGGKAANSPLPYRGSPPLQSGGQNQKWPTSGQSGYLTPAVSGIPTAAERGAKSEVAHKWAKWVPHPCRIGDPHGFRAGGKIRSGPQVGKVANSPLPYRGSPPLQSGGKNQKWPTSGPSGCLTPAVSGIPTAAERGAKSEVAHKWAKWLPHPCRIGDPHRCKAGGKVRSGRQVGKMATSSGIPTATERGSKSEVAHKWAKLTSPCRIGDPYRFRAGGKIRSGPQVGKVANSPLPYWGSLPLQSGGQNQKWPTSGQSGYLTPAVSGIPTASERGAKSEVARKWAKWLPHPYHIGDPHRFRAGVKIRSEWAKRLPHPCRIGDPHRCKAGGIRSGPQVGKMATSPLPYWGSPPLQSGGQNQKWPTSGQSGYLTPAVSGIPTAAERLAKSEVAHKWAKWLPHPCRIGDPHRFRAGGQNQKWPTSGQNGYLTPAVSGIATASERGAKSEVAHKWAK